MSDRPSVSARERAQAVSQSARITRNSLLILAANLLDLLFGLLTVAVFARYLGVEVYGQYAFLSSVVALIIPIPHFGFRRIMMRELSRNRGNVDTYLGSLLLLRGALSLVALFVVFIAVRLLGLTDNYAFAAYLITGAEIAAVFGMSFMTVFFAYENMVYNTLFTLLSRVVGVVLILAVVFFDLGFLALLWALFIPNLLSLFLGYALVAKKFCRPSYKIDTARLSYLLKESFPLFLELVFRQSFLRVDIFVLKALRSLTEIALFNAPYSLITRLQIVPMAFTTALLPLFSRLAEDSRSSFEAIYAKVFKFFLCMTLPMAVAATMLATEITVAIFGEEFKQAAVALQILVWMINLMFLESLFNTVLVSLDKQWFTALTHAIMFVINLGLDILLVPFYGFLGACIGTLSAYVVRFILSYGYIAKNGIHVPFRATFPKPLLSSALMGLIMYFSRDLNWLAALSIGLATYLLAIKLTAAISKEEIGLLKGAISFRGPQQSGRTSRP